MTMPAALQLIGRSSSHFTRLPRIFAHELDVPLELVPVFDLSGVEPAGFGGNPALKIPTLRRPDGALLFGAENICRALAERSSSRRIVWPESLRSDLSRNAQELVWHAMSAQVQWVFGNLIAKLPADNAYFRKARAGLEGALAWLDTHLDATIELLPNDRDLSLFEAALFCLCDHLRFRETVPLSSHRRLAAFTDAFGERPSAQVTAYAFDAPPA